MQLFRKNRQVSHYSFSDLPSLLDKDTLLVFNNTKVRKARLFAETAFGGKVEILLLKQKKENLWEGISNRGRKMKSGKELIFPEQKRAYVKEKTENGLLLEFDKEITEDYLEKHGHIPLPPYMKRGDEALDSHRYQTVFAREIGSAAAPTASLHFTENILESLRQKGIDMTWLTLHVGTGTFLPVKTENVEEHRMHSEEYEISGESVIKIRKAKEEGKKVLAVGTTVVRTLESAFLKEDFKGGRGETSLFIYPGYNFSMVDQIITNFHTPCSSLLMMISAFAGKDFLLSAYQEAINQEYRFFSYGDSMLIL